MKSTTPGGLIQDMETEHDEDAAMTITDIAEALTGERMIGKYTGGGRERASRDDIARLAYYYYETRGRRDGQDLEDWLSAEEALTGHSRHQ